MDPIFTIMTSLLILFIFIMIIRLVGAWMLRINEIIINQRELIQEIKKLNANLGGKPKD